VATDCERLGMATGSVLDVVSAPAAAIGRYFSVLSVLPSTLFTAYAYSLVASNAWSGSPQWTQAAKAFGELGFGGVALLALVSLFLGLVLQPLQYSLVQFCEGYWGTSRAARAVMTARIMHHRQIRSRLHQMQASSLQQLVDAGESPTDDEAGWVKEQRVPQLTDFGEASRMLMRYPHSGNDVRPTRLGNVLRRFEADVGSQYGLPGVTIIPHLALVAPAGDVAYLDDRRTQLDLAVRLAVLSALASAISVLFLWRAGLWILIALAPYTAAYLFYRGAVGLAEGYGTAMSVLVDLSRFSLYERLHLALPTDSVDERRINVALSSLLRDLEPRYLRYAKSGPGSSPDPS
jgi:hypothetical protein